MNELTRKCRILWLTARIKYHRNAMDAEYGVTDGWKTHARTLVSLCREKSDLMTPAERRAYERKEGLV